jgi:penicillin-binding protein 1C
VRRRSVILAVTAAIVATVVLGLASFAPPSPALDRGRDLSALILARDGSILRGFLTTDGKWRLPPADTVDPLYRRMLIATEDRRFEHHPGIDLAALVRAVGQFVATGHIVSGASTLTMQTVRLLERRPRTLRAKLVEMAEALGLERRLGKEEILALHASLVPFGGNLEGMRAASLAYFGKEPTRLSAAEAALLVAIPRSPERLRPDRHPEAARIARDRVLRRMVARGIISPQIMEEARAEPVPNRRLALPFHAPHLARALRDAAPDPAVQRTTIDPLLQRRLEILLRREAAALGDANATLAALIVDNRGRRVLAHVGNAVFEATARRGTLDMTRAVRSPGSALKPFIYGMAFDRLIAHPETIVEDRRRSFGGYAPGDFDGRFQGEVSAREALQYSLNVPAVAVLERLGPGRFVGGLAACGIALRLPARAEEAGLAIALGGAGITLTDLATLYAGLANDGRVTPLRYRDTDPPPAGAALFGPAAAWYVTDILAAAPPPPGLAPAEVRSGRRIAFKTGTSYGYRDAWAVGYDRDVTIAVWAGRPDGTPVPGHSGRLAAAPVLFKIADLLPRSTTPAPPAPPDALLVARRELPAGLRRLATDPPETKRVGDPAGPRILYPPDGASVAWAGQELPLEASGGRGPLRWLVNDRPLPPGRPRKPFFWQPDDPGFVRLTVIDGDGRSARATVRLVP